MTNGNSGHTRDVAATPAKRVVVATMQRPGSPNGVRTHVARVSTLLIENGWTVRVVHPASTRIAAPVLLLSKLLRFSGSQTAVGLDRLARRLLLERALKHEFESAGVGLVYAQDPRSAFASRKMRPSPRVPVVMAVHYNGSQADELVAEGLLQSGSRVEKAVRRFEADVVATVDGLVYMSEFMRKTVERSVPAAAGMRSTVVPNFLPPSDTQLRRTSEGMRDCITVGHLEGRKNHAYLLEVLAAARRAGRRYSLTVVGDGPQRKELERLAARLGVEEHVDFLGSRGDVDQQLRRHRIYVHSAFVENCPYALLEAFREGLPVVAPRVGGIPEVVGEEGAGRYWDLDRPTDGAAVIAEFLDDPAALAQAAVAAATRFEQHFSVEVAGGRLLAFLSAAAHN